jgi:FkbM family methyltransferase
MKSKIVSQLEIFYRENSSDEAVLEHSFSNDIFFPALPDLIMRPNGVVIDIGAHIGTFSMLIATAFSHVKVHAFEPNRESYELLEKNITHNKLLNVKAYRQAVTARVGAVELYHDQSNWGHSTSFDFGGRSETVDGISLSSVFQQQNIQYCDLIKFNCEGAEFEILLSTSESLLENIGMMLILYHEDLQQGAEFNKLYCHLRNAGFRCRTVNKKGQRGWLIAKNRKFYPTEIPKSKVELKLLLKELLLWLSQRTTRSR